MTQTIWLWSCTCRNKEISCLSLASWLSHQESACMWLHPPDLLHEGGGVSLSFAFQSPPTLFFLLLLFFRCDYGFMCIFLNISWGVKKTASLQWKIRTQGQPFHSIYKEHETWTKSYWHSQTQKSNKQKEFNVSWK